MIPKNCFVLGLVLSRFAGLLLFLSCAFPSRPEVDQFLKDGKIKIGNLKYQKDDVKQDQKPKEASKEEVKQDQ